MASPTSQYSRIPDSAIMPASSTRIRTVTPRSGSLMISRSGTAANASVRATARSLGRTPGRRASLKNLADIRMIASLANSDGSIW